MDVGVDIAPEEVTDDVFHFILEPCLATMSSYRTHCLYLSDKNEAALLRHRAPILQVFMNFC